MFTRIFATTTEEIKQAAEIIKEGGLVAFPTETVYGLGADALNAEAVGKVYAGTHGRILAGASYHGSSGTRNYTEGYNRRTGYRRNKNAE